MLKYKNCSLFEPFKIIAFLKAKAKEAQKEVKLAKQLQEEELRILFNEGIANQFGKKKSKAAAAAAKMGISETQKEVQDLLDAMSSDSDDDEKGSQGDNTCW